MTSLKSFTSAPVPPSHAKPGGAPDHFLLRSDRADAYRLRALQEMLQSGIDLVAQVYGLDGAPLLRPGDMVRIRDERLRCGDLIYYWDGVTLRVGRCLDRLWSAREVSLQILPGLSSNLPPVGVPLSSILGRITEAWRGNKPLQLEPVAS